MTDEPNPSDEVQGQVISWDVNKAAIAEVAEELKDIDASKDLPAAKKAKKKLVGMRTELTEYHKETKAKALAFGKQCDTEKNTLMTLIREIEDPISDAIDEIKNAAAKAEEARVAKIMAEIERIQAYALDRHSLTLTELEARLSDLRDQVLDTEFLEEYAEDAQMAKDEADLKLRLAIDREKQEQEQREATEILEAENKRLREEAAERNKEQAERDAEAQKLADKRAEEARAAQKIIDDEKQAEFNRVAEEQEAERKKLDDERLEREAVAAKEQETIERNAAEAEAAELAALQAPDLVKLNLYAKDIDILIKAKPVMGSRSGQGTLLEVIARLIDASDYIKNNIEEL